MKLENLKTEFLGRNIFFYKNIDSTQSEIWRMIEKNIIKNATPTTKIHNELEMQVFFSAMLFLSNKNLNTDSVT